MGWHFHNRIDYIGDSFSIELLACLKNGVALFWGYGRGRIFCQVGSDQDRISPYNINMILTRQVMRIKKILIRRLLFDLIPNSPN